MLSSPRENGQDSLFKEVRFSIVCPEIEQKQAQDRKARFETVQLRIAEILSRVARQAPTKFLQLTVVVQTS